MSISPQELTVGREAEQRIKSYERNKHKRLVLYLIPGVWLFGSLARFEARGNSWNSFQLMFWSLILIIIIILDIKRKREYKRDLAALTQLRKLYGEDISFEIKTIASDSGQDAEDSSGGIDRLDGLRKKGFGPLIGLMGIGIMAVFYYGLRFIAETIWALLK